MNKYVITHGHDEFKLYLADFFIKPLDSGAILTCDIDILEAKVYNSYKMAKSNRVLPMPNVLINDLLKLKQEDKELFIGFNDSFFVAGDNRPLVDSTIRERKNSNCKKAGVKQIRIHDFRHSCASLLIHKGASINIVAKYLGHTKIEETLNTYSHLYTNALSDITNLINEMQES